MIRIEYMTNKETNTVHTTWVRENGVEHSLIGRQVMTTDEWEHVWTAITYGTLGKPVFFKFEMKAAPNV